MRPLLALLLADALCPASTELTERSESSDPAAFQKMLNEMDPARRYAGLKAMGLAAGVEPPPKQLSTNSAEALLAEVLETLRLIHLELAEAWEIHSARTYEQRLKATLPYVEDLLSPLLMKYNFSVGWPGCFMEVLRPMDELQSNHKIKAMINEVKVLLAGQTSTSNTAKEL
eukprot:symbB.v1.2.017364.t1/scaffold1352.1/size234417/13